MAWISTSLNSATVSFKDIGYSTTDATQAEIDFQVTKEPATACQMRGQGPGLQVRRGRLESG